MVVRGSVCDTQFFNASCCATVSAGAALVAEIGQPIQAFLAIQLVPIADRVIVQVENLRDRLAAHSIVEQQQRIRASRQASLALPISHQRDKVSSDCRIKKAAANHVPN